MGISRLVVCLLGRRDSSQAREVHGGKEARSQAVWTPGPVGGGGLAYQRESRVRDTPRIRDGAHRRSP